MRRPAAAVLLLLLLNACATFPDRAYYPTPSDPETMAVAGALYRAAQAAGDDPARYHFALVQSPDVRAYSAEEATFYFAQGLARQPAPVMDALIAHEVAHELLGHAGRRRAVSLSLTAGFAVLGVLLPGISLLDLVVNPLVVRAFTREQELAADLRAVELLRAMAYESPRRTLAEALAAAARINGAPPTGLLATEPTLHDRLTALGDLEPLTAAALPPAPK